MHQLTLASKFPADVIQLDNGLTVIHQYVPATPVVVVDVWVKAGAIVEPDEWCGMAHFLEHMIFKGSDRIPPGLFDHVIESRGGTTNAATSHDYAHFFITTAACHLEETLPALADILLHPAIPDDEFDRERDVVFEEIRQTYDNPDWLGMQALAENLYQYHPYGRPILGTEDHLMARSPQEMRCFHHSHYQPENMTVVIVGGVERDQALKIVEQSFRDFPEPLACPIGTPEAEPPLIDIRRQELYFPQLEQCRLMMAWLGPGIDQLQSACSLDLLSALLAEGRTSRLVRELREERGLVQYISSGFSLQRDSSLFTISACLEAEHLDRVEAVVCDTISTLQGRPVSSQELERGQRLLCNDFAFSTETPNQLAGLYGYYHTLAEADMGVSYPDRIKKLTAVDLQQVISQYLSPYRYAVTILQPC